ncbi:MAG: hypothetical protein EHM33_15225 [Chloroflexi bacterium]|nr:MAG: hypothetical protein EHM33_15225 [Chloroflexota bacterium]
MNPPLCPKGHGLMILMVVTEGEGRGSVQLGKFWGCANDDRNSPDYCDECEDYVEEAQQLVLLEKEKP